MDSAEIRAAVHPYIGIPLSSVIAAGVLASAIAAREPDRVAKRVLSLVLLCTGLWSLFELLTVMAPDAELASRWMRASCLGSYPVAAMVFHLMVRILRPDLDRFRSLVPVVYAASGVAIVLAFATESSVAGVSATRWGWAMVPGPGHLPMYFLVSTGPTLAGITWVVSRMRRSSDSGPGLPAMVGVCCVAFSVATLTDVVLPSLGVPFPRLGSVSLVTLAAVAWWTHYRALDPRLAPQRFAREILETLPDAVALVRSDGRIRSTNERLAQLSGRAASELPGTCIDELLPELGAGDDGEIECDLHAGEARVPVSVSRSSLCGDDGNVIGRVLVMHDLREVTSLRNRLAASGRMAAVGQLAAGIAHEINNPIAFVGANLRLLLRHWTELGSSLSKPQRPAALEALEEGPELLEEACEGVDRVVSIVRDVGGFSGGTRPELASADLADLLDAAARVAKPQLAGARIERSYESRPRLSCRSQELMQVFLNLLVNARHAAGEEGQIRLATRIEGDDAVVEVADDGHGIPASVRERIFEPFFTTKAVGEGTGLGLSISRQIVLDHGGSLEVESEPGRGTRFVIRLPLGSSEASATAPDPAASVGAD